MAMLGKLRERYQRAMAPVGRVLARTGITPNMITGLTLLVALLSAYLFYLGELIPGFIIMVLTVVLDMFDGAVARAADLTSKFGATFDHTLDRYAEWLFIFGLMSGPATSSSKFLPWFWGYFALFGMIMASFVRAKAESVGGMDSCTVGIAERQEKLILIMGGILILGLFPGSWTDLLALLPPDAGSAILAMGINNFLTLFVIIAGLLSHITVAQRLMYARRVILAAERNGTVSAS